MEYKLIETLKAADQSRTAIGHFNVSDSVVLQAVTSAARDAGLPVIIGLSECERTFFGVREAAAMANAVRESHAQPIFVNADHTHSLESAIAAVKAGFDSVVFDRSALPFEQNINHFHRSPDQLGPEEIRAYQVYLFTERKLGARTVGHHTTGSGRACFGYGGPASSRAASTSSRTETAKRQRD